mmetsp:Transcript_20716/g.46001  ORF Transcript_20716/g.46001 Transcript_20716/m.46001 type:complete len:80 (+) Transcript_20716:111-350(+)
MPVVVNVPLPTEECCDVFLDMDEVAYGRGFVTGTEKLLPTSVSVFSTPLTISPEVRTILVPISCRLLADDAATAEAGIA